METKRVKIKTFTGLNTKEDPARLPINIEEGTAPLIKGTNVDIDRTGKPSRRPGYSFMLAGSNIHSLWSNGKVCVFVDGGTLKQLYGDYSTAVLRSGLTIGTRMSYADDLNGRIYYSSGVVIGYLQVGPDRILTDKPILDPEKTFKITPFAGQEIEYYQGRLYVAKDNMIWFSDAAAPGRLDLRKNFKAMDGPITLMKAVEDGLYAADGQTYFLSGEGYKLQRTKVADYNAIPGTAVRVDGKLVGGEGFPGRVQVWVSEQGICIGANGGQFQNMTIRNYMMGSFRRGAGLFKQTNGLNQYISVLTS